MDVPVGPPVLRTSAPVEAMGDSIEVLFADNSKPVKSEELLVAVAGTTGTLKSSSAQTVISRADAKLSIAVGR